MLIKEVIQSWSELISILLIPYDLSALDVQTILQDSCLNEE